MSASFHHTGNWVTDSFRRRVISGRSDWTQQRHKFNCYLKISPARFLHLGRWLIARALFTDKFRKSSLISADWRGCASKTRTFLSFDEFTSINPLGGCSYCFFLACSKFHSPDESRSVCVRLKYDHKVSQRPNSTLLAIKTPHLKTNFYPILRQIWTHI